MDLDPSVDLIDPGTVRNPGGLSSTTISSSLYNTFRSLDIAVAVPSGCAEGLPLTPAVLLD